MFRSLATRGSRWHALRPRAAGSSPLTWHSGAAVASGSPAAERLPPRRPATGPRGPCRVRGYPRHLGHARHGCAGHQRIEIILSTPFVSPRIDTNQSIVYHCADDSCSASPSTLHTAYLKSLAVRACNKEREPPRPPDVCPTPARRVGSSPRGHRAGAAGTRPSTPSRRRAA